MAAGVIALGAIGFLIKQNLDLKKDKEQYEYKIEDLNVEILDLEDDLKDFKVELEDKDLEIQEKDRLLAEKELEILEKQKKIDLLYKTNRITKTEMEELKGKVDQLNYYIKKYQAEIDELKEQVTELTTENNTLKSNVEALQDDKFNLEQENLLKNTMLEAAAILKTDDFQFFRVKRSGKVDEDREFREGRLQTLRCCFDALENTVTKQGTKEVYFVITGPDGKVVNDGNKQSGTFEFQKDQLAYSMKSTLEYDGKTKNVCADYDKPDDQKWVKGDYGVKVYCEGFEIGKSSFTVK
ncbi:MAG: hypothetical protein H6581_29040 [Bacteroidia bacterium]|nr:hypothetical protein [Bacteroidia bacterium]